MKVPHFILCLSIGLNLFFAQEKVAKMVEQYPARKEALFVKNKERAMKLVIDYGNNHFCEYFAKREFGIDSRNFDKTGEFTDRETLILRQEYDSSESPFPVKQLLKELEPTMMRVVFSMFRD